MEITDGSTRFEEIKSSAYYCKSQLDKKPEHYKLDQSVHAYKEFLEHKLKNSTIASAAMRDVYIKQPLEYPTGFRKNIAELAKDPEIITLQNNVRKNLEILYPKTQSLREILVDNNRIKLGKVTPKLRGLKKTILKLMTRI